MITLYNILLENNGLFNLVIEKEAVAEKAWIYCCAIHRSIMV